MPHLELNIYFYCYFHFIFKNCHSKPTILVSDKYFNLKTPYNIEPLTLLWFKTNIGLLPHIFHLPKISIDYNGKSDCSEEGRKIFSHPLTAKSTQENDIYTSPIYPYYKTINCTNEIHLYTKYPQSSVPS